MTDQDAKSTTSSTVQNDSMPYTRFDLLDKIVFAFCLPYKQLGIKYSNAVSRILSLILMFCWSVLPLKRPDITTLGFRGVYKALGLYLDPSIYVPSSTSLIVIFVLITIFIICTVTFGAILAALLMNDRKMPTLIYKASSLLGIICVSPLYGLFVVYLSKPLVCIIPAAKRSINITYCGMKNIIALQIFSVILIIVILTFQFVYRFFVFFSSYRQKSDTDKMANGVVLGPIERWKRRGGNILNSRNGIYNTFVGITGGVWAIVSTVLIEVQPWVNSVLHFLIFAVFALVCIFYLPFNRTAGNKNMAQICGFVSGAGISSIILGLCEIWAKKTAIISGSEQDPGSDETQPTTEDGQPIEQVIVRSIGKLVLPNIVFYISLILFPLLLMFLFGYAAEIRSRSNWLIKPIFDKKKKKQIEWETLYDGRRRKVKYENRHFDRFLIRINGKVIERPLYPTPEEMYQCTQKTSQEQAPKIQRLMKRAIKPQTAEQRQKLTAEKQKNIVTEKQTTPALSPRNKQSNALGSLLSSLVAQSKLQQQNQNKDQNQIPSPAGTPAISPPLLITNNNSSQQRQSELSPTVYQQTNVGQQSPRSPRLLFPPSSLSPDLNRSTTTPNPTNKTFNSNQLKNMVTSAFQHPKGGPQVQKPSQITLGGIPVREAIKEMQIKTPRDMELCIRCLEMQELRENEEFLIFLDSFFGELLKRNKGEFKRSAEFRLTYYIFLQDFRNTPMRMAVQMQKASENFPGFTNRWMIYQKMKELEILATGKGSGGSLAARIGASSGDSSNDSSAESTYTMRMQMAQADKHAEIAKANVIRMWQMLARRSVDVNRVNLHAQKAIENELLALREYVQLMKTFPDTPSIMRHYALLLRDVLSDDVNANHLLRDAEVIEEEESQMHALMQNDDFNEYSGNQLSNKSNINSLSASGQSGDLDQIDLNVALGATNAGQNTSLKRLNASNIRQQQPLSPNGAATMSIIQNKGIEASTVLKQNTQTSAEEIKQRKERRRLRKILEQKRNESRQKHLKMDVTFGQLDTEGQGQQKGVMKYTTILLYSSLIAVMIVILVSFFEIKGIFSTTSTSTNNVRHCIFVDVGGNNIFYHSQQLLAILQQLYARAATAHTNQMVNLIQDDMNQQQKESILREIEQYEIQNIANEYSKLYQETQIQKNIRNKPQKSNLNRNSYKERKTKDFNQFKNAVPVRDSITQQEEDILTCLETDIRTANTDFSTIFLNTYYQSNYKQKTYIWLTTALEEDEDTSLTKTTSKLDNIENITENNQNQTETILEQYTLNESIPTLINQSNSSYQSSSPLSTSSSSSQQQQQLPIPSLHQPNTSPDPMTPEKPIIGIRKDMNDLAGMAAWAQDMGAEIVDRYRIEITPELATIRGLTADLTVNVPYIFTEDIKNVFGDELKLIISESTRGMIIQVICMVVVAIVLFLASTLPLIMGINEVVRDRKQILKLICSLPIESATYAIEKMEQSSQEPREQQRNTLQAQPVNKSQQDGQDNDDKKDSSEQKKENSEQKKEDGVSPKVSARGRSKERDKVNEKDNKDNKLIKVYESKEVLSMMGSNNGQIMNQIMNNSNNNALDNANLQMLNQMGMNMPNATMNNNMNMNMNIMNTNQQMQGTGVMQPLMITGPQQQNVQQTTNPLQQQMQQNIAKYQQLQMNNNQLQMNQQQLQNQLTILQQTIQQNQLQMQQVQQQSQGKTPQQQQQLLQQYQQYQMQAQQSNMQMQVIQQQMQINSKESAEVQNQMQQIQQTQMQLQQQSMMQQMGMNPQQIQQQQQLLMQITQQQQIQQQQQQQQQIRQTTPQGDQQRQKVDPQNKAKQANKQQQKGSQLPQVQQKVLLDDEGYEIDNEEDQLMDRENQNMNMNMQMQMNGMNANMNMMNFQQQQMMLMNQSFGGQAKPNKFGLHYVDLPDEEEDEEEKQYQLEQKQKQQQRQFAKSKIDNQNMNSQMLLSEQDKQEGQQEGEEDEDKKQKPKDQQKEDEPQMSPEEEERERQQQQRSEQVDDKLKSISGIVSSTLRWQLVIGTILIILSTYISFIFSLVVMKQIETISGHIGLSGWRRVTVAQIKALAIAYTYNNLFPLYEEKVGQIREERDQQPSDAYIPQFIYTDPLYTTPAITSTNFSTSRDHCREAMQKLLQLTNALGSIFMQGQSGQILSGDEIFDMINVPAAQGSDKELDEKMTGVQTCMLQDETQCFPGRIPGIEGEFYGLNELLSRLGSSLLDFLKYPLENLTDTNPDYVLVDRAADLDI